MNDDDKGGTKGPKDPEFPDPSEIRKTLEGMFGKMGQGGFSFPGMSNASFMEEEESKEEAEIHESNDDIFHFDLLPRDIKSHLDRFVIRQDEAKKALAIAVCDHYNHVKVAKAHQTENEGASGEWLELQKQNVMVVASMRLKTTVTRQSSVSS